MYKKNLQFNQKKKALTTMQLSHRFLHCWCPNLLHNFHKSSLYTWTLGEHRNLDLMHSQCLVEQDVLKLHDTNFNNSGGAGWINEVTETSMLLLRVHSYNVGFNMFSVQFCTCKCTRNECWTAAALVGRSDARSNVLLMYCLDIILLISVISYIKFLLHLDMHSFGKHTDVIKMSLRQVECLLRG